MTLIDHILSFIPQIEFDEYVAVLKYLRAMKESFMFFGKNDRLSLEEVNEALTRAGFSISSYALSAAIAKFDKHQEGVLRFDQFLGLCIFLSNLRKLFHFFDKDDTGEITISLDQLISCTPYFE